MKVIFLCYRSWAINVALSLAKSFPKNSYEFIHSDEEFKNYFTSSKDVSRCDLVIAIGWSWILPNEIVNNCLCIGLHPSDLPNYRGGSPIQSQIIDGILDSKMSLFKLKSGVDDGPILGQADLSLRGDSILEIFKNIEYSAIDVLTKYFQDYPNVSPRVQNLETGSFRRRRNIADSKLSKLDFDFDNLIPLYNKIRCLTDPYPNAFIEDSQGNRIYFEKIKFIPKSDE